MGTFSEWDRAAANELKAAIASHGLTYGQVVERLSKVGITMSAHAFGKKVNRGGFSHAFFLQCIKALDQRHDSIRPSRSDEKGGKNGL
jgi:DNA (cytosine-5)-methyltransferase 1